MYGRFVKRGLDILLALAAIVVLLPLYVLIGLLVLVFMGWPVIFSQDGYNNGNNPNHNSCSTPPS